jgi:hypothetical protein
VQRPAGRGLRGLRLARSDLIEEVAALAVFATGSSFLLAALPADIPRDWLVLIGVVLVLLSLAYIFRYRIGDLTEASTVQAFFVWDASAKAIVDVDGYEFASELARITRDVLAEAPAMRAEWDAQPLAAATIGGERANKSTSGGGRIIEECVEYMLLEELSMHLIDFFDRPGLDEGHLVELRRDELADIVEGNRVLDLLSRPLADRGRVSPPAAPGSDGPSMVFGEDFIYSRFDLRLPRGATVRRVDDGVEVDSPLVKIHLRATFEGGRAHLSADFAELFLDDRHHGLSSFVVWTEVRTRVKRRALLLRSAWDYFAWVDDFRNHLEASWSGERYFERIGWPGIRALMRVMEVRSAER